MLPELFLLIKRCKLVYSEYSKACNYQPKINKVEDNKLKIKIIDHIFSNIKTKVFAT